LVDIGGGVGVTATTSTVPVSGICSPSANQLNLTTSSSTRLAVTTSGYVEIGTTTPGYLLEIDGRDEVLSLKSTGDVGVAMVLDASPGDGHDYHLYSTTTQAGQGAGYFIVNDRLSADRLVIDPSGHVGIGTDTPGPRSERSSEGGHLRRRLSN
jgi:hypothetical protein